MFTHELHAALYPVNHLRHRGDYHAQNNRTSCFHRLPEVAQLAVELRRYLRVLLGVDAELALLAEEVFERGASLLEQSYHAGVEGELHTVAGSLLRADSLKSVRKVEQNRLGVASRAVYVGQRYTELRGNLFERAGVKASRVRDIVVHVAEDVAYFLRFDACRARCALPLLQALYVHAEALRETVKRRRAVDVAVKQLACGERSCYRRGNVFDEIADF